MKPIIIVGAGAFGKEVYTVIESLNYEASTKGQEPPYKLLGFIDDNLDALKDSPIKAPVLGRVSGWTPLGDEVYAVGAAFPDTKRKMVEPLKTKGCRFETLIAPWSIVSSDFIMGEGCFVTAYSISAGVTLGDFVNVMGSMLCSGTVIGDYSTTTGFTVVENAEIGRDVFVGSHAVVASGVHVGNNVMISVGSIVVSDVEDGTTVFGVPATVIA